MSFCALPVFLAFLLNRCSIRFFTSCRCLLGFTPFSASVLFGLALVTLIIKHPELYPCWLRRVNCKLMFLYELFVSIIFIEIGYCLWNSIETFLFYKIPSFLEEHCSPLGDFYINTVESPVGVSLISNILALSLLFLALHTTRICNFNLLFKDNLAQAYNQSQKINIDFEHLEDTKFSEKLLPTILNSGRSNGVHRFFADAGLTTKLCKHHREVRLFEESAAKICCQKKFCYTPPASRPVSAGSFTPLCIPRTCVSVKEPVSRCAKILRSGKKFY